MTKFYITISAHNTCIIFEKYLILLQNCNYLHNLFIDESRVLKCSEWLRESFDCRFYHRKLLKLNWIFISTLLYFSRNEQSMYLLSSNRYYVTKFSLLRGQEIYKVTNIVGGEIILSPPFSIIGGGIAPSAPPGFTALYIYSIYCIYIWVIPCQLDLF